MPKLLLQNYITLFEYYKTLGDKSMAQLSEEEAFFWSPGPESNSIAIIVQHLYCLLYTSPSPRDRG